MNNKELAAFSESIVLINQAIAELEKAGHTDRKLRGLKHMDGKYTGALQQLVDLRATLENRVERLRSTGH